MFCQKCGEKLTEGSVICSKCGDKAGAKPAAAKKKSIIKIVLTVLAGCFLVLALIAGIFFAIVSPKFDGMMTHARQEDAKGKLEQIRSMISLYYGDKGKYPAIEEINSDKFKYYLDTVPKENIKKSNKIVNKFDGTGGFYYCDDPNSPDYGKVFLNLEGNDNVGKAFRDY